MPLEILGPIDRSAETSLGPLPGSWDTVWPDATGALDFQAWGDWAMADPVLEPRNAGGLAARDPYGTAIRIQLGTHKRRGQGIPGDAGDLRGWWGDSFGIDEAAGEGPMGSWLWTLKRAAITQDLLRLGEYFVEEALQTLFVQGAATSVQCRAEADKEKGWLYLSVQVYIPGRELPYEIDLPPYPLWS